jgi:hypothetical protein
VLSRLFRGKFLAALERLYEHGALDLGGACATFADPDVFRLLKRELYAADWVVYAKPPFAGAEQVYRYLGRYTHRIAISNARLEAFDEKGVRFATKHGKSTTLGAEEFIRRFLLHVLPEGFHRIRHYGLLAAGNLKDKLELARRALVGSVVIDRGSVPSDIHPDSERLPEADPSAARSARSARWCRISFPSPPHAPRRSRSPHDRPGQDAARRRSAPDVCLRG